MEETKVINKSKGKYQITIHRKLEGDGITLHLEGNQELKDLCKEFVVEGDNVAFEPISSVIIERKRVKALVMNHNNFHSCLSVLFTEDFLNKKALRLELPTLQGLRDFEHNLSYVRNLIEIMLEAKGLNNTTTKINITVN